ncbi:MAG: BMP family ABC transporter substrate-binding protein [Candidatus Hodarchaeales archaeon]
MKIRTHIFILLILVLMSLGSNNFAVASINEPVDNIAVIVDSSEFYHESYIEDIKRGFENINQTYGIDYTIFQLEDFHLTRLYPYNVTYKFNNSLTNHSELAKTLVGDYDMIVFIGYELRRGAFDPSMYPETKFLYYDLAGDLPESIPDLSQIPQNVIIVSFKENEIGFIAGTLAAETIPIFPESVLMIGSYYSGASWFDPRSRSLIAGFQSGVSRIRSDVKFVSAYVGNYWENIGNYSEAKKLASSLNSEGYKLVFSALQNNNTLGIIDGFTSTTIIGTDSNRTNNIFKNNTKTLMSLFNTINQSQSTFPAGYYTFSFEDDVYSLSHWDGSPSVINETMNTLYQDIVVNGLEIPTDLHYASNTPGFSLISILSSFLIIPILNKVRKRKK